MKRLVKWLWPVLLLLALPALIHAGPAAPDRLPRITTGPESGLVRMDGRTMIDLNRADAALLESIPGVGPALAARIAAFIQKKGALTAPSELQEVDGIGPVKLRAIEENAVIRTP